MVKIFGPDKEDPIDVDWGTRDENLHQLVTLSFSSPCLQSAREDVETESQQKRTHSAPTARHLSPDDDDDSRDIKSKTFKERAQSVGAINLETSDYDLNTPLETEEKIFEKTDLEDKETILKSLEHIPLDKTEIVYDDEATIKAIAMSYDDETGIETFNENIKNINKSSSFDDVQQVLAETSSSSSMGDETTTLPGETDGDTDIEIIKNEKPASYTFIDVDENIPDHGKSGSSIFSCFRSILKF